MIRSMKMGWVFLAGFGLLGCAANIDEKGAGDGENVTTEDVPLEFDSRAELHEWLANKASELGLSDVVVHRDAEGTVDSLVMPGESRDVLFASLLGNKGHFTLEGHEIAPERTAVRPDLLQASSVASSLAPAAPADVPITTRATSGIPSAQTNCSGAFCVTGRSWNNHYSIFSFGYHDVGGDVSAPGIVTTYPAINAATNTCNTRIGCSPPVWTCNAGDKLSIVQTRTSWGTVVETRTCIHTVGFAAVTNTYFSNTSNCGSGHCQNVPTPVATYSALNSGYANASQSLTAIGYFVISCNNGFGPAECYVDGVCSSQFAMGPGGAASTRTAAGSYDCL
ncbi:MAG TPA: hypothetical protein VFZ53_10960 [Polyangiaceae bacterium]